MDDQKNILDDLPTYDINPKCKKCGSSDWSGAKFNESDGGIVRCSKCPDAHEFVGSEIPQHCKHCGASGFDQNLPSSCSGRRFQ